MENMLYIFLFAQHDSIAISTRMMETPNDSSRASREEEDRSREKLMLSVVVIVVQHNLTQPENIEVGCSNQGMDTKCCNYQCKETTTMQEDFPKKNQLDREPVTKTTRAN